MSKRRTDNLRAHLDAARTEAAALRAALVDYRYLLCRWLADWEAAREDGGTLPADTRAVLAASPPSAAPGTGMAAGQRCTRPVHVGDDPDRHYHAPKFDGEVAWTKFYGAAEHERCPYVEPPVAGTPEVTFTKDSARHVAVAGPLPVARLDPVTVEACAHPARLPRPPAFNCPLSPRPPVSGESVTGAGRRWRRANAIVQVVEPRDWVYVDEDPAAVWAWCSFDLYAKTGAEAREVAASIALDGLSVKQVTAAQKGGKRR